MISEHNEKDQQLGSKKDVLVEGNLDITRNANGIALFAHWRKRVSLPDIYMR